MIWEHREGRLLGIYIGRILVEHSFLEIFWVVTNGDWQSAINGWVPFVYPLFHTHSLVEHWMTPLLGVTNGIRQPAING